MFSNSVIRRLTMVSIFLVLTSSIFVFATLSDIDESSAYPGGSCGTSVNWEYNSTSKVLTISGTGDMNDYILGTAPWSTYGTSIEHVIIQNGVTHIGNYAFRNCTNFTSVSIPDTVTSIGNYAFFSCSSLVSVILPDGITTIEDYTFYGCSSMASISIPEGVTSIGDHGIYSCSSLTSIHLPNSLTYIGDWAFRSCTNLTSINLPVGLTYLGDAAFFYCTALPSIDIPYTVTSIGNRAFDSCIRLTTVTIPDGITSIGDYAFHECGGLKSIVIPDTVTSIGKYAFDHCLSLTSVNIPEHMTSVGTYAFNFCSSLTSLVISGSSTFFDEAAFCNCSTLPSVVLPEGTTSLSKLMFAGCSSLSSVTLPDSITTIEDGVFSSCTSLPSIVLPEGITFIGWGTFGTCTSLTSIVIPDHVAFIDRYAFYSCTNLRSVTIPASVTNIINTGFSSCTNLKTLILTGSSSDHNTLMSNSIWSGTHISGMPGSFTDIIIDGYVDLNGLTPNTSLKLSFTNNIPDSFVSDGLVPTTSAFDNIRADSSLADSVYRYNSSSSKWERDNSFSTYTIMLVANGGSCISEMTALSGSPVYLPAPMMNGYVFGNWYESSSLTGAPVSSPYSPISDITLYAKYNERSYTVSYDPNGGSSTMGADTISYSNLLRGYELKSCTFDPPTGKTFCGWGLGLSDIYAENARLSVGDLDGDIIVYAIWASTITVSFDANGGTVTPADKNVAFGSNYGTLPIPVNEGYNFDGWYLAGTKITSSSIVMSHADHTLVASWSSAPTHSVAHDVKVTFKSDGGYSVQAFKMVKYGHTYGALPTPMKDGCIFNGWYLNGTLISSTSKVMTKEDHTLTAMWSYQINADVSDGNSGLKEYTPLIVVFAASALMFMMLLVLAYIRRRKDEDE